MESLEFSICKIISFANRGYLKKKLPYDAAILGFFFKDIEMLIQKDICTPIFIAALFTIIKIWEKPKCPLIDEQIKKIWYILDVWWNIKP